MQSLSHQTQLLIATLDRLITLTGLSLGTFCTLTHGLKPPERLHRSNLSLALKDCRRGISLPQLMVIAALLKVHPGALFFHPHTLDRARVLSKIFSLIVEQNAEAQDEELLNFLNRRELSANV